VNIQSLLKKTNANACIECGKCTSNCPVSRFNPHFSPRLQMTWFFQFDRNNLLASDSIWDCLTCGMCTVRCPMDVKFTEFTREIRQTAFENGKPVECSHGGALQALMEIMTADRLKQQRTDWLTPDLNIAETGEVLFFVGCAPYFDAFFTELKINTLDIARSTIKLLNKFGITPAILPNERCCGHDLLWAGNFKAYQALAEKNMAAIQIVKPKTVIFSCAECYRTFKLDYPELFGTLDFEVLHLTEFLTERLGPNQIQFKELPEKVTYQDPCRLGRQLGIYEPPRKLLSQIPGVELIEMQKNRQNAVCCGTSAWINCNAYSKMIQMYRLKMAHQTGAELLVTSCPKCYIHFTCALQSEKFPEEAKIEIKDLALVAAEAIA